MKRIDTILFTTALSFLWLPLFGQWNFDNQGVIYSNNANVGIGTNDPWCKLQVIGTIGLGNLITSQQAGLLIDYIDGGAGTTVFKHQRWGGDFYFKRNDAAGERTQLFFGGSGNHYMDIYNNNNEVKVRFNTGGDSYFNGGNVGIGITTPTSRLHLFNPSGATFLNVDKPSTSSEGGIQFSRAGTTLFYLWNDDGEDALKIEATGLSGENDATPRMMFPLTNKNIFMALSGGNVGIGTTAPDAKLAVKGTVHAQEVKVDLNIPGPDYVFEENYNLPSLTEIENYIKQNKHLPEVPSAKEMETNGINLSEMNMLLLKKVEELTLHLIEKEKQMKTMEARISQLEKQ